MPAYYLRLSFPVAPLTFDNRPLYPARKYTSINQMLFMVIPKIWSEKLFNCGIFPI
jgi:hypothetical protein